MSDAVRRCQVCEHPSVLGINQAILNGKSYRAISRDYRIGSERSGSFKADHAKVRRHAEGCMATSFQKVQEANLTAQGEAIHARMKYLDEQVDVAIADALKGEPQMIGDTPLLEDDGSVKMVRSMGHVRALLAAVREGRQNAALVAKLAGAMPDEDADALEHARKGLEDPAVRALVQQMEQRLAELESEQGRDKIEG
jgi:hypothetical protein